MRVAIRVDAGAAMGIGHAMRCATLADALTGRGHEVVVVTTGLPPAVHERFAAAGARVRLAHDDPGALVVEGAPDWCVVDGYHLGGEVAALAARHVRVAMVDDNGELPTGLAALVVNQNPHADRLDYPGVPAERVLRGLRYALIRPDVRRVARDADAPAEEPVVVVLGGTDPRRLTVDVVRRLLATCDRDVLVAGADHHPDRDALVDLSAGPRVALAAPDLVAAFGVAGLGVVGGGTTLWELAHLGIPSVALVVADNQEAGSAAAERHGVAVAVDCRAGLPADRFDAAVTRVSAPGVGEAMARRGPLLVDGRGAERVVAAMESIR